MHKWIYWTTLGIFCAIGLGQIIWHVPMRMLLAHVSPGWALYMVVMGSTLLGMVSPLQNMKPIKRRTLSSDISILLSFAMIIVFSRLLIGYIDVFSHPRSTALLENDLLFAWGISLMFGQSLVSVYSFVRRIYDERITVWNASHAADAAAARVEREEL